MAEEIKKEATPKTSSSLIKVILGIVLLVLGVAAVMSWFGDLLTVLRGCIGLILILASLITFAIAKE